jgi:hypothetical protein
VTACGVTPRSGTGANKTNASRRPPPPPLPSSPPPHVQLLHAHILGVEPHGLQHRLHHVLAAVGLPPRLAAVRELLQDAAGPALDAGVRGVGLHGPQGAGQGAGAHQCGVGQQGEAPKDVQTLHKGRKRGGGGGGGDVAGSLREGLGELQLVAGGGGTCARTISFWMEVVGGHEVDGRVCVCGGGGGKSSRGYLGPNFLLSVVGCARIWSAGKWRDVHNAPQNQCRVLGGQGMDDMFPKGVRERDTACAESTNRALHPSHVHMLVHGRVHTV